MSSAPLLTKEEALSLLDSQQGGWKHDREGWVTITGSGIAWRVHYRNGELLEVGWWGILGRTPSRRKTRESVLRIERAGSAVQDRSRDTPGSRAQQLRLRRPRRTAH